MTQPLMFKLDQNAKGRGLRCDRDGLFFAGIALLERDAEDQFRSIPATTIRTVLSSAYRADGNWESRIRSVDVVAKALNGGDMARAMMAAVLMRLPEPDSGIHIADIDSVLAKAGFNPAEPRDERGWWTTDGGDGGGRLIPAQWAGTIAEPWFGPLIEQVPVKPVPMPSPTDIVPPVVVPRGLTREPASNPYPRKKKCVKEWADAEKRCREYFNGGKLDGSNGNRGFGETLEQCLRGQVSEECGGNPTSFEIA